MLVTLTATLPADTDCRVYPIARDAAVDLPLESATLIAEAAKASRFTGDTGGWFELFVSEGGRTLRVVLLGTGEGKVADLEKAGGTISARLLTSGVKHVAVIGGALSADALAALSLGARLRAWRFDTYRTKQTEAQKPSVETLAIVTAESADAAPFVHADAIVSGVSFTRELVAEPGNILYPESFVERCKSLTDLGIEVSILDEKDMAALGMGALLGVGQGSVRPSRMLALRWDGSAGAQPQPLAFVGKGVTFDTGGISLKPGAGMEDMKWDMGGAGAVAGVMKALALRKAKAHVVGVCGLVENMPDGNAQRPGDVVTTMSGQTVEVINTDAEGRLVLADTLWWTQKTFGPKTVIDLATLTGAIIAALADQYGGLFANDDTLAGQLTAAGEATGEKLWRFPMGDVYDKMIDSPIADMKNMGARYAGSITAAQFLKRYILEGVSWAHLDIAGMVWADKPGTLHDKGATGYGVRLLDRVVADLLETA
ncbi:leucyl aminopeptidase [Sphingobium sufflavum]|uniref:leucyl aminopeptidase n=1 Tax=Sphingobium sufflavum TaxID=1129547 RepID=UPI001F355A20|nr:leucyl aminopeptidase [Sphingobium sufflavum]MCE7797780.1 leucyl aminopeptidase [Sphingobium sufflavum]